MSHFRTIDRDTPYLLPPLVDEWLPVHHLARFVVVDPLGLSALTGVDRGAGVLSPALLAGRIPRLNERDFCELSRIGCHIRIKRASVDIKGGQCGKGRRWRPCITRVGSGLERCFGL
jgi:hypothetical protein